MDSTIRDAGTANVQRRERDGGAPVGFTKDEGALVRPSKNARPAWLAPGGSATHKQMAIVAWTILALSIMAVAYGQDDAVTAARATIQAVDSTGKTIVVKTDDGVAHTIHYLNSTAVHGGEAADSAGEDSWHGLKAGAEVVVHYTTTGTSETAVEIDRVGAGGLKTTHGTVKEIDRGGKKLVVATGGGMEETFQLTGKAARETGSGVAEGSKITVFYISSAGKKVAHFLAAN